jgi:hypothetical protein
MVEQQQNRQVGYNDGGSLTEAKHYSWPLATGSDQMNCQLGLYGTQLFITPLTILTITTTMTPS